MADELTLIERKIHYHELYFEYCDEYHVDRPDGDQFLNFFSTIALMARDKEAIRYQQMNEVKLFVQDVIFLDQEKKISGKLRSVRVDDFPELINLVTDTTKSMEAAEDEGIVETTHFVIDYSKRIKKIAIEYNHAGAKITDFVAYCQKIGAIKKSVQVAQYVPISKDELVKIKERINYISKLTLRVHKDNIDKIENMDKGIFSALKNIKDQYEPEYAELALKFNVKKVRGVQDVQKSIKSIMNKLIEDRKNVHSFDVLKVNAQDDERNNRLRLFDLLVDKVESKIKVQKKVKYKTIISEDIIDKMKDELRRRRI